MAVRAVASETHVDERTLRHPWERPVYVLSAVFNILILVAAVLAVAKGPAWLHAHPVLAKRVVQLRAVAIVGLVAVPGVVLLRNTRWAGTLWDSVKLSPQQMPQLHALVVKHCAVFGMPVPEVYLSCTQSGVARAYTSWHHVYIVIGDKLLQSDLAPMIDAIAFNMAREIGRIRLEHTAWWDELLISYIVRIPVLRTPLMHLRAYSADRYGAYLEPGGIRGLLALSTGRRMLPRLDLAEYLRDMPSGRNFSAALAEFSHAEPPIGRRIRALYALGLFGDSGSSRLPPQ